MAPSRERSKRPDKLMQLLRERVDILHKLARECVKTNPQRAKRYVSLARKLCTRYNLRLPKDLKRSFCKKCYTIWIPGYNLNVRIRSKEKLAEYSCSCGAIFRFPIKKS
ncbi:Ribonuclease P protein component 4 [Candidatus Gugararchaeum adminiculabundum]|nr:Ribonuclease P protein component 4 [Candidatus Gugararchaeum adminiculabundum]